MGDSLDVSSLLRLALSFAVIIGALLALKWWSHRGGSTATKGSIKISGRVGITRGAVVCIVEADSRHFLVGVTEQAISLISELEHEPMDFVDLRDGVTTGTAQDSEPLGSAESLVANAPVFAELSPELLRTGSVTTNSEPTAPTSGVDWLDNTESLRIEDSSRPWNGLVRRAQSMTLRAPSRVPVHAQRS